jgi:fatty acid desaturase
VQGVNNETGNSHRFFLRQARIQPPGSELAQRLKALATVSTAWGVGVCLLDWVIILAAALGSWAMFSMQGITTSSVLTYAVAAFVIATRLQGLRNLIHEASHYNLSRNRPLNDFMCRVATFPVQPFLDLEEQRRVHVRSHHARFLNPDDNVFRGYEALGLDVLPLPSRWKGLVVLVRGLLRHCYWQVARDFSIKRLKKTNLPVCLTAAGMLAVVLVFFPKIGLLCIAAWLLYWVIPAVFVMPPISFVVLIAEHLSTSGDTEFERSRNKLGVFQRVLLHPHGDGYHMLHHLCPGVPHNRLGRAHRLLMTDPVYRNGNHCYGLFLGRRSVLWAILDGPPRPPRGPVDQDRGLPNAARPELMAEIETAA